MKHFKKIKYDMTELVDASLKSFLTDFLSLEHMLDFTMIFLCEGVKALLRYTYAILKSNKKFVLEQTEPRSILANLRQRSLIYTSAADLPVFAAKFKIGAARKHKYTENKNELPTVSHSDALLLEYLPNSSLESKIVTYQ